MPHYIMIVLQENWTTISNCHKKFTSLLVYRPPYQGWPKVLRAPNKFHALFHRLPFPTKTKTKRGNRELINFHVTTMNKIVERRQSLPPFYGKKLKSLTRQKSFYHPYWTSCTGCNFADKTIFFHNFLISSSYLHDINQATKVNQNFYNSVNLHITSAI